MTRVFNFSAGPAALPEAVLRQAADEMLDYRGTGMCVAEMSHRSAAFRDIAETAEADLRELLNVGDDHAVLFLQGGATGQFSAIPLNLLPDDGIADYVNTGSWSKKAIAEAKRFGEVRVIASSEDAGYSHVPAIEPNADAAYLHITPNETIGGLEFADYPDSPAPLVADFSSSILSRPLDVSRFGVIYAGAQKNIGPAGLTVVIVRRDLLGRARSTTPAALDWQLAADNGSMYNTPPTYAWYLAGLVFSWLKDLGGLAEMETINRRKAGKLYAAIDASNYYTSPIEPAFRSLMNVPFTLADPAQDKAFLDGAAEAGLVNLGGHRSVGGMRASIYNAVPEAAVDTLVDFMAEFERTHA